MERDRPHDGTVRLHENLTLLETERAAQMDELLLIPEVRAAMVRLLDPCTAVLDTRRLARMLETLERHGQLPRVVDAEPRR